MNLLFIMCDELIAFHNLPEEILKDMKGFNAFRKKGIEFTGIKANRQMCSPSRSCFITGQINTQIQDNIDLKYQYDYVSKLNEKLNTIGKEFKKNNFSTCFYGKQHLDNKLSTENETLPIFSSNTNGSMKTYGFDNYSSFGDPYYYSNEGFLGDCLLTEMIMPVNSVNYDYYCEKTKNKLSGIIPFLKSKKQNNEKFFLYGSFQNPHDIQQAWQNLD